MSITLQNLGRRYNREWIFRRLDYTFSLGKKYAVLGSNGSGKSTLLKVLSGSLAPSEGKIAYEDKDIQPILPEDVFQQLTIAAPYMELIEEFTLRELIAFHFKFKSYLPGFDLNEVVRTLQLEKAVDKEIRFFSSGMKQRVKLALACCSSSSIVLLDEPMSNLDVAGEDWYLSLIGHTMQANRVLIIGSNQQKEYGFCDEQINIMSYK
ncbi:ABC transporter ATP-binding protein [Sphingobacterium corticibacterium]|uniref:ATP-binding cassette domain-containing protein n=1 Tax=Sphingobacterium corticibacterium TaxID=2484746 RepID=A0A4Q6XM20_9SPHI|nr:ATP-binding cassette domain-containing protein [Sphingobacterium corticibacterium]RZF58412.1 ATP-binding cassette domain-containing protein [Sphingobacterium corticibacterium]